MSEVKSSLISYHARRKQFVADMGGACTVCGSTENVGFVWSPDVPDDVRGRVKKLGCIGNASEETRHVVMPFVVLLCKQHVKEAVYGTVEDMKHGAYHVAYRKKCPCSPCQDFKLQFSAARREKRSAASAGKPRKPRAARVQKINYVVSDVARESLQLTGRPDWMDAAKQLVFSSLHGKKMSLDEALRGVTATQSIEHYQHRVAVWHRYEDDIVVQLVTEGERSGSFNIYQLM